MRRMLTVVLAVTGLFCAGSVLAAKGAVAKLKIEGMHCAGCASSVVTELQKLKGVKSATVDMKSQLGTVQYDPAAVKPADLVSRVKVAGFHSKIVK